MHQSGPLYLRVLTFCAHSCTVRLTQTERSQPEYDEERLADGDVLVRGVLEIESYHWLSEYGRKVLQNDLNQRDTQWRIDTPRWVGGYTLETLYNIHSTARGTIPPVRMAKVKVWIQGVKRKPAAYMTCKPFTCNMGCNIAK